METILIVDDNKGNLEQYRGLIAENFPEAQVLTASNENEAVEIINKNEGIDVIVTDLMMKGKEAGITVLNEAKKKDPLTMVIIITAFDSKLDRKKAFDLGAFDCLVKASAGVKTADELIYKTKSANFARKIAIALVESQKKIDSFKRYFDPIVFEKIKKNPNLLIPQDRTITIVFWDIRGFSSLNETLKTDINLIIGFLKEFFEVASKVIFSYNGVLDKFIGDGVMALFGAFDENVENEDKHAIAALQAAIKLREEFNAIYLKWEKQWKRVSPDNIDIGLGCGIHTGQALVGNVGTNLRDHFTAIGPHVNLAARIESTAKKGEIRFSSTTKARVDDHFKINKIDTLTRIKNINGSFDIFIIVE